METLGQFVGLLVLLFVVFWAGFFTAASMASEGTPGSQAQQEARELERMRRSRT